MTRRSAASAPGKVILSGEHFVVHGSYSLAAAINKRVSVSIKQTAGKSRVVSDGLTSPLSSNDGSFRAVKTVATKILNIIPKSENVPLEISIVSEIPPGSGLGSSAAVSVATAAAMSSFFQLSLNNEDISEIAFHGEKAVHGNPSGIDNQACLRGGLILFRKNSATKSVRIEKPIKLLIVFSGKKRSTSRLIEKVARRRTEFPNYFQKLVSSASDLSLELVDSVESGDTHKIGSLFTIAQSELSWIGVSTNRLESLIDFVLSQHAVLGAKLTGAGGGGSIIAAIQEGSGDNVLNAILPRYHFSFVTEIPQEGLRWED